MSRLNKAELATHRDWLSCWRVPAEMAAYVAAVNERMGSADFIRQGGIEFLRDAWLAAEFGRLRQCEEVRLVAEGRQWPDFEARQAGDKELFECVEAIDPNRQRGNEYRQFVHQAADVDLHIEDDPVEDWIDRARKAPKALSEAITKKVGKHYASGASLLVYLNIDEFGIHQAEIEAAMAPAVQPALAHFRHVWILWKARLYGPWSSQVQSC